MKTNKKKYLGLFTAILLCISVFSCKKQSIDNSVESAAKKSDQMHEFNLGGNKILIKEDKGTYYLADDIILTEKQFNLLKANSNMAMSTTARALIMNSLVKKWPNNVVYYNLTELGVDTSASIQAMNIISLISPITFVKRTAEANYINIRKSTGNNSPVGMVGGAQNVNLTDYKGPGIIIHEIFHSLGVMHEQCRPDRDDYIIVNYSNIDPNSAFNYNKVAAADYTSVGMPLNLESIMMYAADPVGSPQKMTKLDGSRYETSFPSADVSPVDIAGINQLYTGFNYVGLPANVNYEIATALNNTKLLNVPGSATADGTQVILYTDGNSNNARWNVTKNADGYYKLSPLHALSKALTVVNSGTTNGTKLEIRTNTGTTAQQFSIVPLGNDNYSIFPRNAPALAIDVPGSATANGTLLNIYGGYYVNNNQKFKFNTF